ncbi:transposase [Paenibacillus sp. FSL K6-4396]|uniref:transposase n=1 Tax=unclassified Paenibacillus TaxID=185978 RepID=UPI00177E7483|nr:transposase [Paenibacillus sp. CFBP 13594]MBD8840889.1 transposase [Paenibacillus sp. CFBP 13594]
MKKKGQTFQTYTEEFKLNAVRSYVEDSSSYKVVADREGIRNCSQLKVWVKNGKTGKRSMSEKTMFQIQ